jgi:hypothetical protein
MAIVGTRGEFTSGDRGFHREIGRSGGFNREIKRSGDQKIKERESPDLLISLLSLTS